MTIYVDVFFLENVVMNFLILTSCYFLVNRKFKFGRCLLASCIGGIYSILNYIYCFSTVINFFSKLIISILLIRITFSYCNFRTFFKQFVLLYLVSFVYGGAAFMLVFMINTTNFISKLVLWIGEVQLNIIIFGGIMSFFTIFLVSKFYSRRVENQICEIEIFFNGKSKKIKTFIDTGNMLKDPITMDDVIVIEKESLDYILDYSFLDNIDKILNGNLLSNGLDFMKSKIRLIPFSSLGNENGLLIGFRPDYIKIYSDEVKIAKNAIIGVYNGKLSKSNVYTGLIGLNILKESDVFEKSIANI